MLMLPPRGSAPPLPPSSAPLPCPPKWETSLSVGSGCGGPGQTLPACGEIGSTAGSTPRERCRFSLTPVVALGF